MDLSGTLFLPVLAAGLVVIAGLLLLAFALRRPSGRVIKVVGIGSGGANTVDAMIHARIRGVEYVVVNTDSHALRRSSARRSIHIGKGMTHGVGTGGDSGVGETAARDAAETIARALAGADLVVITAGLGGGTGSGAAPVVADIARQSGALTMAVVTKPFNFEGARRRQVAERAAVVLADKADAVATVQNDRVREVMPADVTVEDAFAEIDRVVSRSIGEVVQLIGATGRINLDFADVRAVLKGGGAAVLGVGRASGEQRATEAARGAMAATLLEGRVDGATSILVNVSGSQKLKLAELDAVVKTVLSSAPGANLAFGMGLHRELGEEIQVTLVATGLDTSRPRASASAASATDEEEWRPVWLRRSGTTPPESMSSTPRSRRAKRRGGASPHGHEGQESPDLNPST
jgi:cell division protein FtsZ